MDGLSAAASVIAVVQISGQIFDLCRTYYLEVKDARKDIQRLRDEVTSLQDVLANVADLADSPGSAKLSILDLLNQPDGPVQQCQTELAELAARLRPGQGKDKMKQFGLRALKWPFSSKDVDKAITAIGRHKATFNLALTTDHSTLALAIDKGVTELTRQFEAAQAETVNHRTDEHCDKIIQWLSTTDPSSNHHAACKKHQPTTGEWLIKRTNFEDWKTTRSSLLWLHGIPGCGKTILSSTIIEHMKVYCDSKPGLAVAYFYFDFNDAEKQNAANCISSLIAQLCSQIVDLPEKLKELYKRYNDGKQKAATRELKASLFAMAEKLDDVFIIADALDECPNNGELQEVLEFITEISTQSPSNIHLLVTSRPEPDIRELLLPLPTTQAVSIQGSQVESDIKLHISSQLKTDSKLKKWPSEVKAEIEKALAEKANGMFRWVFCQLDVLKRCKKRDALRDALRSLPQTLDETYERILINIDKENQQEARHALLWLAFSKRPLRIEEVAEAAVVDPEKDTPFDPEGRLLDPRNNILEILGSLVTLSWKDPLSGVSDDSSDYGSGHLSSGEIIRFAHFSVQEYLVSGRIKDSKALKFSVTDVAANYFIARSCLLYIFHYDKSDFKTTSPEDLECFPLLQYACRFWYTHVKSLPAENQKPIDPVIFQLFLSDTALISWLRVHRTDDPMDEGFEISDNIGTPLYYASDIGLQTVVQLLLEHKADVDAKKVDGRAALHQAASNGHEAVVRLLLKHKANADAKDSHRRTALHRAASNRHEVVVQLLLEHKADVGAMDNNGWTAVHLVADNGDEAVMRLLLEHKADVDAKDKYGWTAVHWAVDNRDEAMMRLLLEHKADIDVKGSNGRTALHWAAHNGDEAMMRLLLEHKADIDAKDNNGWTAVCWAAEKGDEAMMRLLLEHKADVNAKDDDGWTAVHWAANSRDEAMMRLLLEYKADVDAKDNYECTAMHKADVDAKDNYGCTAMHWAARRQNEVMIRLLLEHKADVDAKDNNGWTAAHWAAIRQNEVIMRLLLEHKADVDAKDKNGWTAMHWAADNRDEAMMRLLFEHKADVDAKDNNGWTAAHWAAIRQNEVIMRLLLEHKADVDAKDNNGRTSMQLAVDNGDEAMMRLLLERKADVDAKDNNGWTAAHWATIRHNEVMMRLLLEHKADVNVKDDNGWTAMHLAADDGDEAIMQLLESALRSE